MSETPGASPLPGMRTFPAVVEALDRLETHLLNSYLPTVGSADRNRGPLLPQKATEVPDGGVAAEPRMWPDRL
jgi:hypothetical protein